MAASGSASASASAPAPATASGSTSRSRSRSRPVRERGTDATATTSSGGTSPTSDQHILPPIVTHANTAYGDWIAEVDSSAPLLADQLYGNNDEGLGIRPSLLRGHSHQSRTSAAAGGGNNDGDEEEGDEEEDADADTGNDEHLRWAREKKWYRRPDERWLRPFAFLLALASGSIMGAKIEIYYSLICEEMGITALSVLDTGLAVRPPVSTQCHKSPAANAAQATLQLKLTLAMGLLSAITTGYWGSLSDRRGRTYVLRLAVFGLTFNDLFFLAVGIFPVSSLPFGKNFLVIGSALEGCLGGFATLAAGHQAYIADVTPNGTRAKIFSFFAGILFFGFAFGPSFGGILSKSTDSLMSPFYFALASHFVYLLFTILILPESVSPDRQRIAREEHAKQSSESQESAQTKSIWSNLLTSLLVPLRPLALFLPHRRHDDKEIKEPEAADSHHANTSHISVSRTRTHKLDWNLTFLALAYFLESACFGVVGPKINYAQYTFDWNIEQLGYYLSFGSISRVLCLTVIIPLFIKWWHRPIQGIALPHDGTDTGGRSQGGSEADDVRQPLLDEDGRPALINGNNNYGSILPPLPSEQHQSRSTATKRVEKLWTLRARHLRQIHDSAFDKRLAITSIGIDALCYLLFAVSRNMGPIPFVIITAITSLGGAASAAMSSLALALLEKDSDAGKLFAGWSVLSAISATVAGPVVFIELYAKTVGFAPESIFVLAFAIFLISALALSFVQVRKPISLPSLPPRPHTPASLRAKKQQQQQVDAFTQTSNTPNQQSVDSSNSRRSSRSFAKTTA